MADLSKIDQLIWDFYAKASGIVLQGRRAFVSPLQSPHETEISFADNNEYCNKCLRPWKKNISCPMVLDLYITDPTSGAPQLLERWLFIYQRRDDRVEINTVSRKIVALMRALYCFVRMLPGYQFLTMATRPPAISFQIYAPKSSLDELKFPMSSFYYEFPRVSTPKGVLIMSVTYLHNKILQQLLSIPASFTWTPPHQSNAGDDPYSAAIPIPDGRISRRNSREAATMVPAIAAMSYGDKSSPIGIYGTSLEHQRRRSSSADMPAVQSSPGHQQVALLSVRQQQQQVMMNNSPQMSIPMPSPPVSRQGSFKVGSFGSSKGLHSSRPLQYYERSSPSSFSPSSLQPVFSLLDNGIAASPNAPSSSFLQQQVFGNPINYNHPALSGFLENVAASPPFPPAQMTLYSTSPQVNAMNMQSMMANYRKLQLGERSGTSAKVSTLTNDLETELPISLPHSPFDILVDGSEPAAGNAGETRGRRASSDFSNDSPGAVLNTQSANNCGHEGSDDEDAASEDDDLPFAWGHSESNTHLGIAAGNSNSEQQWAGAPPALVSFQPYRYANHPHIYGAQNISVANLELAALEMQGLKEFRMRFESH